MADLQITTDDEPIRYDLFPDAAAHLEDGVKRYIERGIPPGDFLTAVICNDLFGAMGRADLNSRAALFDICFWFYNYAPSGCFGSSTAMDRWIEERRDATDGGRHG